MNLSHQQFQRIVLLALILRLTLPITSYLLNQNTQRFYQPDTATYLSPAQEWLQTGQYANNNTPELIRPPGYAFFLLPGIIANHVALITIALQIFLSLLTLYFTIKITSQITPNPDTQKWVGYFAAIEPLGILYASQLLTETLFATLITAALYTLIKSQQSQKTILIAAILYAGATYVRPIGYYLPIAMLIPLIYTHIPLKRIALFILIALGLPILWQLRNIAVANYSSFSAISSINLYFYQGASIKAKQSGNSFSTQQRQQGYRDSSNYFQTHPKQRDWTPSQRLNYMSQEGTKLLLQYPFIYARIHINGLIRTLFDPGAIDLLKMLNAYPSRGGLLSQIVDHGLFKILKRLYTHYPFVFLTNVALGLLLLLFYILAILALKQLASVHKLPLLFCLVTCIYFVLLSGGPHSLSRFRHPIMPIIVIFAGLGQTYLKKTHSSN